jgi:hypothetical protein
MIRYFDGMGSEKTAYVQGLEAKIVELEKTLETVLHPKIPIGETTVTTLQKTPIMGEMTSEQVQQTNRRVKAKKT